ncbi:MAG: lytic murein transglycosylase [Solirubrobacteraceae bacterium]
MSGLRGVGPLPRRPSWRTALSALAGGGLTLAGLAGPLTGGALGAEGPAGSTTTGEGAEPPVASTTPESGASTTGTSTTSTSTTPSTTTSTTSTPTTTPTTTQPATPAPATTEPAGEAGAPPTVVLRHSQQATPSKPASRSETQTKSKSTGGAASPNNASTSSGTNTTASGPSNVAPAPQLVAGQAQALAAMLDGAGGASAQALDFYRIPLFLLPIYQAAAVQYDVPWPILAAINEIETDYGTDLSVSSAGAEGWMQFEPSTWLQYGVDALNAGYADPYNPVDAIFAAARYLNAAGAAHNLNAAILAYNHSQEYVESVLLRAKLIAAYPDQVIATLTGLIDGRPPVTGKHIGWSAPLPAAGTQLPSSSSATAGASAVSPSASGEAAASTAASPASIGSPAAAASSSSTTTPTTTTPGSSPAPAPTTAAGAATATGAGLQLVDVTSEPNAHVVAVQDGRVLKLGYSRKLGKYLVLRDVDGDVFTYAGLGGIAHSYELPKSDLAASAASVSAESPGSPARGGEGSAAAATAVASVSESSSSSTGSGKVRVFAHPGNPDARAAIARARNAAADSPGNGRRTLHAGSIVAEGAVLGHVATPAGAADGHLRFAIRPAGDSSTIDPRAILENWTQLDAALHPRGAKGNPSLLGATASDVFLLSKSELERAVLSDPGIALSACSRHEVSSGAIDKRALALVAFLSRSGLKPTVGTLPCGPYAASGYVSTGHAGDAVAIVSINGVPIAGHQGAGSITDTTIRTLLTMQGEFVPARIVSLMKYPGAPTTLARADHGDYIEIVFAPAPAHLSAASAAHAAGVGKSASATAQTPVAVVGELSATQWEQLVTRIAELPAPSVRFKPSSAAIPDH